MSNFLFVHIPKTGGGSVRSWFKFNVKDQKKKLVPKINGTHDPYEVYFKHYKERNQLQKLESFTSFSIVRNPYSRTVSWYTWFPTKLAYNIEKNVNVQFSEQMGRVLDKGIEYWFDYMVNNRSDFVMSQYRFAGRVDTILPFENLSDEFRKISDMVGVHKPLLKNVHVNKYDKDINELLTPNLKRKIEKTFAEDFDVFGYNDKLSEIPLFFHK